MTTNQGKRQASFRAISGTTFDYNGDLIAAVAAEGITATGYNGSLIAWLQSAIPSTNTEINGLKAEYATLFGASSWNELGYFIPSKNLILWLDADDDSTISTDVGVDAWADKSGEDNDAAQSTDASQPALVVGAQNGRNVIRGDGTDDVLTFPNLSLNGDTDVTLFMVFKSDATTSGFDTPICFGTNAEGNIQTRGTGNPDSGDLKLIGMGLDGTENIVVGQGFNAMQVFTLITNASTWSTYVDGVADETDNTADAAWSTGAGNYALFAGNAGGREMKGDIAEVIIYDRELSDAERSNVETYLIEKWGL